MPLLLSGTLTNAGLKLRGDNGNVADGQMALTIVAFEFSMPPSPLDVWFSTKDGFLAATISPPVNFAGQVSGGDLLSRHGHIVRTNAELTAKLGIMPVVPDLGLDAVMIGKDGDIWFSFRQSNAQIWSETHARWLSHGDLLSESGHVVAAGEQLLEAFQAAPVPGGAGLDGVARSPNGEILFSTDIGFFSQALGRQVKHGDLISNRGRLVRTNVELLQRFSPIDLLLRPSPWDYGLDVIVTRPFGEIWFSTEEGFLDEHLGWISDGDLLSTSGYVVARNLDLVSAFGPIEDLDNFGLDAVAAVARSSVGDFDGDGDVDHSDFGVFQTAISGPSLDSALPEFGDLDGDGDVDQIDFGLFQRCISGPDIISDANCGL
jgi:hypothetical protein